MCQVSWIVISRIRNDIIIDLTSLLHNAINKPWIPVFKCITVQTNCQLSHCGNHGALHPLPNAIHKSLVNSASSTSSHTYLPTSEKRICISDLISDIRRTFFFNKISNQLTEMAPFVNIQSRD